jgi:hypothetical protein
LVDLRLKAKARNRMAAKRRIGRFTYEEDRQPPWRKLPPRLGPRSKRLSERPKSWAFP